MKNLIRAIIAYFFPRCDAYDTTLERSIFHLRRYVETPNKIYRDYTGTPQNWETRTTVEGQRTENKRKNRYTNILPYDQTAVLLNSSGYINANFVYTYLDVTSESHLRDTVDPTVNKDLAESECIQYICTQGPMEASERHDDTLSDFWEMVVQEKSRLVVMVTQLIQKNQLNVLNIGRM